MSKDFSHPIAEQRLAQLSAVEDLHVAGRFQEAADLCARLIARAPDFHPYHVLRGRALVMLGDTAGGVVSFETALSINPDDSIALELLAQCFLQAFRQKQDYGSASALIRAALLNPEPDMELLDKPVRFLFKGFFLKYPEFRTSLTPSVMLTDWCAANGIDFDILELGGIITLVDIDGVALPPYDSPALKFAALPGASIVGGIDMALAPEGTFLYPDDFNLLGRRRVPFGTPDLYMPYYWDLQHRRLLHGRAGEPVFVDRDVLLLTGLQRHHFGHWLIDHLPRLRYWARARGGRPEILISENLPAAHRQTLARFNVQSADLFEMRRGQEYRFRSVTVMHTADGHRPAPPTLRFLYSALATRQTPRPSEGTGKRYFLERSQTINGRNVANLNEFQAVLDEFYFETVRRPELSIEEQNEKFSEAEIILTVFGSDMYTLLQVPPRTDVIVLTPRNLDDILIGIEPVPARYCAVLGMRIHSIICELIQRPFQPPYNSDVVVDCAALRETLAGITARRAVDPSAALRNAPSVTLV